MKEIVINFDVFGGANIEVNGCTGPSCKDSTKEIEVILGGSTDSKNKPDYFKPNLLESVNRHI